MSTIVRGPSGRTDVTSQISGSGVYAKRTNPSLTNDAIFNKVHIVSGSADGAGTSIFEATGSNRGVSGVIMKSAGNSYLWPIKGNKIAASDLTAKSQYDIGIKKVSGSGYFYLLY